MLGTQRELSGVALYTTRNGMFAARLNNRRSTGCFGWIYCVAGCLAPHGDVCGIARCAELYGIFAALLHAWYAMGCLQRFWTLGMQQNLCGVARCAARN